MVESERLMVISAPQRYGEFYAHAEAAAIFFSLCLKSIDPDRWVFAQYHSLAKKHLMLAVFSTLRLHKVQSTMDLRQVLEAGAFASCAIAKSDPMEFVEVDSHGLVTQPKKLTNRLYGWLDKNYAAGSTNIKRWKDEINDTSAHANLIQASINVLVREREFAAPFFDLEDEYFVKTDLWRIGSVTLAVLDLYFGVVQDNPSVKLVDDFLDRFRDILQQNRALEAIMKSTDRYKRAMERASKI